MGTKKHLPSHSSRRKKKKAATSNNNVQHLQHLQHRKRGFVYHHVLNTSRMLFCPSMWEKWPPCHALATKPITDERVTEIAIKIFGKDNPDLEDVKKLIHKMLRNNNHICSKAVAKIWMTNEHHCRRKREGKDTDPQVVANFVRFLCVKILPAELVGDSNNWIKFSKVISEMLHTPRRETVFLGTIMLGFKLSQVKWLTNVKCCTRKPSLYSKLLIWVIEEIIFQLVAKHFYVTDATGSHHKLVFFWKPTWQAFETASVNMLIKANRLKPVLKDAAKALEYPIPHIPTNTGKMRFIPKPSGFRLVIRTTYTYQKKLAETLRLLNALCLDVHHSITASSRKQFYQSVEPILSLHAETREPLFFVCCDIKDAFGSIDHIRLCMVLNDIMHDKYRMSRAIALFRETFPSRDMDYAMKLLYAVPPLVTRQTACLPGENRYYHMTHGLPQGSILSTALCNLYYGAMDNDHMGMFLHNGILIRAVDDYLYITPHRESAERFKQRMEAGFPNYSCYVNPTKTQTNLDPKTLQISYCNILINPVTLALSSDYAAVAGDQLVYRSKINLRFRFNGTKFIENNMKRISWHLHGLHLSQGHNPPGCILRNVYKASLLYASRFRALMEHLWRSHANNQAIINIVKKTVKRIADRSFWIMNKKPKNFDNTITDGFSGWMFRKVMVFYLGYQAFRVALSRNSTRYKFALKHITQLLATLRGKMSKVELRRLKRVLDVPGESKIIKREHRRR